MDSVDFAKHINGLVEYTACEFRGEAAVNLRLLKRQIDETQAELDARKAGEEALRKRDSGSALPSLACLVRGTFRHPGYGRRMRDLQRELASLHEEADSFVTKNNAPMVRFTTFGDRPRFGLRSLLTEAELPRTVERNVRTPIRTVAR